MFPVWKVFKIIVPISLPGMSSILIFSMILAWEELLFALVLTNRNASTIPVAIAGISADRYIGANWAALTAVGTITVVPLVIFALRSVGDFRLNGSEVADQGLAEGMTKG